MTPSDAALLLVLGTADADPTATAEIIAIAQYIAPYDWQPTADVIRAAAERGRRSGLLERVDPAAGAAEPRLKTTVLGRERIVDLLRLPIPRFNGGFMRTCMSVKLCFLHHLPQPERGRASEDLAHLFREAIAALLPPPRLLRSLAGPALQGLREEILRLESELAWLDGMTAWQPQQHAAE